MCCRYQLPDHTLRNLSPSIVHWRVISIMGPTGVFFSHFLILLLLVPVTEQASCTKIGPCTCNSPNGVIDLTNLAKKDGTPRFLDLPDNINLYKFSWNPCFPFSQGMCTNVAACQSVTVRFGYSLGSQDSADFVDVNGQLALHYIAANRQSYVKLICDSGEGALTLDGEIPLGSGAFYFTLKSKYACPKSRSSDSNTSLSVGSVLLIVFFAVIALYVIGGVIFLTAVRKATGRERIPNVAFWTSLPGLVKSGVRLIFCRRRGTYEKM